MLATYRLGGKKPCMHVINERTLHAINPEAFSIFCWLFHIYSYGENSILYLLLSIFLKSSKMKKLSIFKIS